MGINSISRFLICLFVFFPFWVSAEDVGNSSEEKNPDLESEELWIQDTFPQYRMNFYHKSVQEEVYDEFLKEQKQKKENSSKSKD